MSHDSQECKLRVLLADNHQLIRLGISTALARVPAMTVLEVTDGELLEDAVKRQQPDVLLLAPNLVNGALTTRLSQIQRQSPATRILVMLYDGTGDCIRSLIDSGASGCILKTEPVQTFVTAVRSTARGENWISQSLVKDLLKGKPVTSKLTERELDVLRLISAEKTDRTIAHELNVSERTVRRYLNSIYDKLDVNSRTGAAYWAGKDRLFA